jgi:hypothetical protein
MIGERRLLLRRRLCDTSGRKCVFATTQIVPAPVEGRLSYRGCLNHLYNLIATGHLRAQDATLSDLGHLLEIGVVSTVVYFKFHGRVIAHIGCDSLFALKRQYNLIALLSCGRIFGPQILISINSRKI